MTGSAGKSINARRRGDLIYVTNADAWSGGPPPTGWTLVGGGASSAVANISPYGAAAALQINGAAGTYLHQTLLFPANALLRVSVWGLNTTGGAGTDATAEMWDVGLGSMFTGAQAITTSSTATRLEFYVPPSSRASAATGKLLLRHVNATGNSQFSGVVIEDMTN